MLTVFRDLFTTHPVFSTGLLLFTGYFMGKIAEKLHFPSITGYILAGLLLGESVLNFVPSEIAIQLNSLTEIALGLIALTIGAEFSFRRLHRTGRAILTITLFQGLFAFIFVLAGFLFTHLNMNYVLILAAIATATAPAATVVIVKELRARGDFVDYLYGVVAIDDALCVILFSIIFALVAPSLAGSGDAELMSGIIDAGAEIIYSVLLGGVCGAALNFLVRKRNQQNEILILSLGILFITTAAAIVLHLSLLIANMTLGAVLINLSDKNKRVFRVIEPITPPVFALFFVLAGAELHLGVFTQGWVILYGVIYLVTRFAGKYTGTYISAVLTKSSPGIKKYLGFCLFPQAGVAIGLVLFVQTSPVLNGPGVPESVKSMLVLTVNIVLLSIFVNELLGPSIARYGVKKGADLE